MGIQMQPCCCPSNIECLACDGDVAAETMSVDIKGAECSELNGIYLLDPGDEFPSVGDIVEGSCDGIGSQEATGYICTPDPESGLWCCTWSLKDTDSELSQIDTDSYPQEPAEAITAHGPSLRFNVEYNGVTDETTAYLSLSWQPVSDVIGERPAELIYWWARVYSSTRVCSEDFEFRAADLAYDDECEWCGSSGWDSASNIVVGAA